MQHVYVIFTGTDPESSAGGIGVVMKGYFKGLKLVGLPFDSITTYHPTGFAGKCLIWITSIPKLLKTVRNIRSRGFQPVVYSHAGAGFSLFREACLLFICRLVGAKTIFHIHASQVDSYLNSQIKSILFKAALIPAVLVIVLTPWWRTRLKASGVRNRVEVIPNPLPLELENIARQDKKYFKCTQSINSEQVNVLTMARLVSGKGVNIVINAMKFLPSTVHLIIAGDGSERLRLERAAEQLDLGERIRFLGWVSDNKKKRLLEKADIFCLPSTNDAFPLSFMEAMAYGVPVIGVKWGGIQDMVADQKVGILVDAPDASLVSDAIIKMLNQNVRLRAGIAAKRWVLEISSAKAVGKRIKEVIMSV